MISIIPMLLRFPVSFYSFFLKHFTTAPATHSSDSVLPPAYSLNPNSFLLQLDLLCVLFSPLVFWVHSFFYFTSTAHNCVYSPFKINLTSKACHLNDFLGSTLCLRLGKTQTEIRFTVNLLWELFRLLSITQGNLKVKCIFKYKSMPINDILPSILHGENMLFYWEPL